MKYKILYTIPNFDTAGSGKALLNLAKGLNKNKFETHIACLHDRGDFFNAVKDSGIPVHVFNYLSPVRPIGKLIKNTWLVSRRLKKIKPDLIHSFNYNADYTEAISARMAGIPWVFTKKNMSWGGSSKRAWKLRSALAKGIIVQNTDMIKQFYPEKSNLQLISRGVDTTKFSPRAPDLSSKEKMNTPADARVIICVANFVPVKGIEVLLQAFEILLPEFPGWVLWLIGDDANDYGRKLNAWVKEHGMETKVKFSGKQGDIRPYLNLSEIFVLPTLEKGEGTPVAMLEAMANGKVVIGSSVPGIKDQLRDYSNHLFIPGDSQSLSGKLRIFMAATVNENIHLGRSFIEYARGQFTIEREILEHETFYEKILFKS